MTIVTVNKKLSIATCQKVELVKADGYFYFTFTSFKDGELEMFETESVYTCHFTSFSNDEWVGLGLDFFKECERKRLSQ